MLENLILLVVGCISLVLFTYLKSEKGRNAQYTQAYKYTLSHFSIFPRENAKQKYASFILLRSKNDAGSQIVYCYTFSSYTNKNIKLKSLLNFPFQSPQYFPFQNMKRFLPHTPKRKVAQ